MNLPESASDFFSLCDKHPVLYSLVVVPALTALINAFNDAIKVRFPRIAGALGRAGFDPVGAVKKLLAGKGPPPLPVFAFAIVLLTSCTPGQIQTAKNAEPIVDVACKIIAHSIEPGAETLCATADEIFDAAIEIATWEEHAMSARMDSPKVQTKMFDIIKAHRAAKDAAKKAGGK